MKKQAKITLVGAGPGDPELITVKGLKALRQADVVLYDALVSKELLYEAQPLARLIFVGKRAGKHRYSQEEINLLMVQMAYRYGHVVRLKGGDPFVFGRGQEELEFAQAFDIEIQVIPGISSCIAVPELQEVPLTRRGINESFWVMTATTRSGNLSKDVAVAARSSATVVILMGMRKLEVIQRTFQKAGKGNTPVMVVQSGSTAAENVALGTVNTIVGEVKRLALGSPGIIVIGEVVNLHPELRIAAEVKKKQQPQQHPLEPIAPTAPTENEKHQ